MDESIQNTPEYNRLLHDQGERLKELACINRTTSILKEFKPIEESLQQIVLLLPAAWQYPENGKFFRHIRFEKPLLMRMDGGKGMAVISMNN